MKYQCNYCELSGDNCGCCECELPDEDDHPTRCVQDGVVVPWRMESE